MKKTLLATATLSILIASGMANAAFTDADGSGGWSESLEFNGTITNTNPMWKYKIPAAAEQAANTFNIKRDQGVIEGNNTNFNFTDKNFTVLEGVMKDLAPKSGLGLTPIIVFGEVGKTIVWDTSNQSMSKPTNISIGVRKEISQIGQLSFKLQGQAATQAVYKGAIWPDNIGYSNVSKAANLLMSQPYYNKTYSKYPSRDDGGPQVAGVGHSSTFPLIGSVYTDMSSALIVDAFAFKLSVPTAFIPDKWTATLPISITVK